MTDYIICYVLYKIKPTNINTDQLYLYLWLQLPIYGRPLNASPTVIYGFN